MTVQPREKKHSTEKVKRGRTHGSARSPACTLPSPQAGQLSHYKVLDKTAVKTFYIVRIIWLGRVSNPSPINEICNILEFLRNKLHRH